MRKFSHNLITLLLIVPFLFLNTSQSPVLIGKGAMNEETGEFEAVLGENTGIFIPKEIFTANVSAYSSSIDETDNSPFYTADQNRVYDGVIACPRTYKFGTYFLIEGRVYYCGDRFNKRFELALNKDGMIHIDIWKESKEEAVGFGRQYLKVMVLEEI